MTSAGELTLTSSRPVGGTYALDQLWRRLGLDAVIRRQLTGRKLDPRVELSCSRWPPTGPWPPPPSSPRPCGITGDVHIDGLDEIDEQSCYRAMDYLLTIEPSLAEEALSPCLQNLLNLEVDLLFFDTTSTYFETGEEDDPVPRDEDGQRVTEDSGEAVKETGFRARGKSKDSRDDLPQVVVGMAVTRDGIPVRVWSWPGSTTDTDLIRQVRADIRGMDPLAGHLGRRPRLHLLENRRALMRGGGGYIIGEKLRSGSAEVKAALSRQGRYAAVRDNMQVKEVNVGTDDRFVLCYNPAQAERDAIVRAKLTGQLEEVITGTDKLTRTERARIEGTLSGKPGLKRFLRVTPGGLLRVDKQKIRTETNLDGKYLLRCSDPHLSAEDIALGYKQLLEVERGWRDMKQVLDLRPVYHRREDRIRAHVLLCWLALLLIRVAETTACGSWTWNRIFAELQRIHAVTYTGPARTFRQTTEPGKPQRDILTALGLDPPKKIIEITPKP